MERWHSSSKRRKVNCDIRDFILVHGKILRETTSVEEPTVPGRTEEADDFRPPSRAPGFTGIGGKRTKQSTIDLRGGVGASSERNAREHVPATNFSKGVRRKVSAGSIGGVGGTRAPDVVNKENMENGGAEDCDAASRAPLLADSSCSEGHVEGREKSRGGEVQDKARVKRSPLSSLSTQSSRCPDTRPGRPGVSREEHTTVDLSFAGTSRHGTSPWPSAVCRQGGTSVANTNAGIQPLVGSSGTATHTIPVCSQSWVHCREHRPRQRACKESLALTLVQQKSKTVEGCVPPCPGAVLSSQEQLQPLPPLSTITDNLAEVLQQKDEIMLSIDDVIVSSCDTDDLLAELSYYEKL